MIYLAPLSSLDRFCVSTCKFFCRCIPLCLILVTVSAVQAAAPDDINTSQRAWYDAVDIDADSDYTNNPANNAPISDWWDKSGSGNHISAAGTSQPLYRHNSISPQRHGLDFDGINDNVDVDVTGGTDADGNGIDDMFDGGDTTPLACNGTSGSDEDSFTADWSDNCFVSQSNANRQSEYTRGIQRILNCLGYPQDDPAAELADDADFGENTALAVSAFQTDSNLSSVDGVVGPETWGALEDVLVPVPALSDDSATAYTVGFWDPDGDGFDNTQCPAPVDVLFYENLNPTDGQAIWQQADEPGSTARRPFKIGFD